MIRIITVASCPESIPEAKFGSLVNRGVEHHGAPVCALYSFLELHLQYRVFPWAYEKGARMMSMRNAMLAAATGAGMLALSAASASAAVVCRGDVCWHTKTVYEYPADAGVVVHEDSWRAGPHITFREHEGRGYWHEGKWRTW